MLISLHSQESSTKLRNVVSCCIAMNFNLYRHDLNLRTNGSFLSYFTIITSQISCRTSSHRTDCTIASLWVIDLKYNLSNKQDVSIPRIPTQKIYRFWCYVPDIIRIRVQYIEERGSFGIKLLSYGKLSPSPVI